MAKNIYLTDEENRALSLLSEEKSYRVVERECDVPHAKLPLFMQGLRRKTGISDLRDAQEVKNYCAAYAQAMSGTLSKVQLEAMRRVLGIDYDTHSLIALGNRMGIGPVEAIDAYETGLRAAGIFSKDGATQRLQARMFLATCAQEGKQPLTESHKKVMRLLVQGYTRDAIQAETGWNTQHIRLLISEIAQRLGVVCRGRGAQDKLIRFAAARLEKEKEPQAPIKPVESAPEYDLDSY